MVEQFLNTLDERTFSVHGERHVPSDELCSLAGLSAWLRAHHLDDAELAESDLNVAVALRASLRQLLGGGAVELSAFDPYALRLAPDSAGHLRIAADTGVAGLDVIVETVATSVAAGKWHRLKLCASPDCRWAFYDTSRSGGGRWCSMDVCGNRHKTRTYRRSRAQRSQ
ncbi:CGNR zinc finger domain-containing protein [Mycobacterium sp. MS1601]|uniref:CGNR zinc finger domain-containing protein n=1 Tax=Mycobacterium sp. MS1601 TaxID=1936029 RepID=UPI001F42847B|nr:CGNR zinc finger domain-containing protein [Mycobacterium sp. MS1601]